jgi:hypothetical protein
MIALAPHKHGYQWPCRPGAARDVKMVEVQQETGIRSETGLLDYLIDLGIELHTIRARANSRASASIADSAFWEKALPYLKRK